jgi:hypothetical protein
MVYVEMQVQMQDLADAVAGVQVQALVKDVGLKHRYRLE